MDHQSETKPYRLFAGRGMGSQIVEIAFEQCGLTPEIVYLGWDDLGWESTTLRDVNPLGQVPTLVLPTGEVMTETAAILLHLNDAFPHVQLAPAPDAPERTRFLRWLIFLVSAVYPTFTYGDVPERWVGEDKKTGAGKALRESTDAHRKELLEFLEASIEGPFWLGSQLTAIDFYLWPMAHWRPGQEWMKANCPKIAKIADAVSKLPAAGPVIARNFPTKGDQS